MVVSKSTLIDKTKLNQFNFFSETANLLASEGINFLQKKSQVKLMWKGKARKILEIDELQNITLECSKTELQRIIRATHCEKFPLKLRFNDFDFYLKN